MYKVRTEIETINQISISNLQGSIISGITVTNKHQDTILFGGFEGDFKEKGGSQVSILGRVNSQV